MSLIHAFNFATSLPIFNLCACCSKVCLFSMNSASLWFYHLHFFFKCSVFCWRCIETNPWRWTFKLKIISPSTNPFLFLVELSLFSTRAFSKLHFFSSLAWHFKTYPSSVSTWGTHGDHMGISNLTGKYPKIVKQSAISDQLLQCNCMINFDNFNILAAESNKFKLLLRESLLIKGDKPILNRTIKPFPLELFD